jgi:hypothetical protein
MPGSTESAKPTGTAFSIYDYMVARTVRRMRSRGVGASVPAKRWRRGPVKAVAESTRGRAEDLRDPGALGERGYGRARPAVKLVVPKSA